MSPAGHAADDALEPAAGGELEQPGPVETGGVHGGRGIDGAGPDPRRPAAPVGARCPVQRRQRAAQRLVVSGGPGCLVDRGGDEEAGVDEHDVGHRRRPAHVAELVQSGGLVEGTRTGLGDEVAPTPPTIQAVPPSGRVDSIGPSARARRPRTSASGRRLSHARHDGPMANAGIAGLVLTPGASAGREQSGLVAIDEAVTRTGVAVERVEFPGQAAGKRRTDPPAVCIQTVRAATDGAGGATLRPDPPHRHRRSFLRRPDVLHGRRRGPGRGRAGPGQLPAPSARVAPNGCARSTFPSLRLPCLFVSGRRDAFATPEELERETAAIPGPVTRVARRRRPLVAQERGRGRRHRRHLGGRALPAGVNRLGAATVSGHRTGVEDGPADLGPPRGLVGRCRAGPRGSAPG